MPLPQSQITPQTPLGANVVDGLGVTFRAWAPNASAVYVNGDFNGWPEDRDPSAALVNDGRGVWSGFVAGLRDGDAYLFYVVGAGKGFKRDPLARELTREPAFPDSRCVVRRPGAYPWHDRGFRAPAFNDLVIYQLHVGTYYGVDASGKDDRRGHAATFLDVIDRVEYLADLGVNAVGPLPVDEFPTSTSEGYNGTDYFSPEALYTVPPGPELDRHAKAVNALLAGKGLPALPPGTLDAQVNQLKAMVDVFHAYGIAVFFDVVYNHAGGDFGDGSLYFFDRQPSGDNNRSLYFTDQGWAGGLVFAYWNAGVRQYLVENARFYLRECHADGFRGDEVTVIDGHGGWGFCQEWTDAVRAVRPSGFQAAEYWRDDQSWVVRPTASGGAGFDAVWSDRLRGAVRGAIGQASAGAGAAVALDPVRDGIYPPANIPEAWRSVHCVENHDVVFAGRDPRVPALADGADHGSWYARSRSRVATGLLLTAPGVPLVFMGQEFLEDKPWSDSDPNLLIDWNALSSDKTRQDHLRFCRELIALRNREPALRGDPVNVFHVHDGNRVIAFHRWLAGNGRDVVVVASLNESTFWSYQVGFPIPGRWNEVFNSDVYDGWVNPVVAGNGGGLTADGPPLHGLPASASVVIPANGLVVFTRDGGG